MKLTMTKLGQAILLASGTALMLSPLVLAAAGPAGAQAPPTMIVVLLLTECPVIRRQARQWYDPYLAL